MHGMQAHLGTTHDLEQHLGCLGDGLDSPPDSPSFIRSESSILRSQMSGSFASSMLDSTCHSQLITRTDTQMSTIAEDQGMQRKLQVRMPSFAGVVHSSCSAAPVQ